MGTSGDTMFGPALNPHLPRTHNYITPATRNQPSPGPLPEPHLGPNFDPFRGAFITRFRYKSRPKKASTATPFWAPRGTNPGDAGAPTSAAQGALNPIPQNRRAENRVPRCPHPLNLTPDLQGANFAENRPQENLDREQSKNDKKSAKKRLESV